jgi:fibro-slime domain-containing protein
MTKSWARVGAIVVSGLALAGCDVGGSAVYQHQDAGPDVPLVKHDVGADGPIVIVNLDVPRAPDAPPLSCVVIDGGEYCVSMTCGNGILEGTEGCDDGNTAPSDGCTSECKLESGWVCLAPGVRCQPKCGDGLQAGGELCDDGNTLAGDGCPGDCSQVEPGWSCPAAGVRCQPDCGDGRQLGGEECDDGNTKASDGCTSDCKLESDSICPTPGSPCISTVVCGDGVVAGNEVCDDHNTKADDGCAADCHQVETGWSCPAPGAPCQPKCGDGHQIGGEECDDGNTDADDGCSGTCKVEAGYACPDGGKACHKTVCGDKTKEGAESCDDGNTLPGDGCTTDCRAEPKCTGTDGCTSPCGDGLRLPTEECDDGNQKSGDGCSADCKIEAGWNCADVVETTTSVPIYYRDMMPQTATTTDPPPHPNFEVPTPSGRVIPDIVKDTLGDDREPVYNPDVDITASMTTNADDFNSWYHDSKYSKVVIDKLTLTAQADGTFVYDNSGVWDRAGGTWTTPAFFPLDDRGWATPPDGPEIEFLGTCDYDKAKHNFGFTSEVRYWFEYQGGEKLSFTGDDDVWVFVNGKRAVDLGGVHTAANGSVTLDETTAGQFNLTVGKIYEIVVFQAERRVYRSSYKLTLGKFNRTRTQCTPRCGDGVVNGSESCDCGDGTAPVPATCSEPNNNASYGGCTEACTWGGYCGDGIMNGPEECDDGVNTTRYGATSACAPGCHKPHYCGDGHVDGQFGEQCDSGPANSDTAYGGCTTLCKFGPTCGDGIVNGPEECDDGVNTAKYGDTTHCGPGCYRPHYCGDNKVDYVFGEQCDNGVANGHSMCDEVCKNVVP